MRRRHMRITRVIRFSAMLLAGHLGLLSLEVFSQDLFFQGKTITLIQGRGPGGTGDLRVKALIPLLQKYIPGNPTIVNEYMTGGGGRKASNHIYGGVRPDGLTIGNVGIGLISGAILGETGILYDLDKLVYLGAPVSARHMIFFSRGEAGFSSLEKLRSAVGVRIGAESVGHSGYIQGRIFAWLLGLREPRFVTGYAPAEIEVGLIRGEMDAHATNADAVAQRHPDWIEKKLMHFHAIMPVPKGVKHDRFPQLPELDAFASSEQEHRLLALHRAFWLPGQPFIAPPGVPKERARILQEAFRKAYSDPEFHLNFRKLVGDDPSPLMPEELERVVREFPRDPATIELYKRVASHNPLLPR
jgi:tripartite-type tricarboxylate transporter receptor subunit TctC